jgi:hypothetical protein
MGLVRHLYATFESYSCSMNLHRLCNPRIGTCRCRCHHLNR